MPKGVFWAGVIASAVFALLALAWGLNVFAVAEVALPGSASWMADRGAGFAAGAVLLSLPLAALMLRMAARLASRRLFDAVVTIVSVAAAVVLTLGSALLLSPFFAEDVLALAGAGLSLAALFSAMGVLSLRSYFEIQSSRTLGFLVVLPLPLAVAFTSVMGLGSPAGEPVTAARSLFVVLALTTAAAFGAIAVHALRHSRMFTEATGLRELIERSGTAAEAEGNELAFGSEPLADG